MDPASRLRFLDIFPAVGAATAAVEGDELNEDDVLWTNDFTEQSLVSSATAKNNENTNNYNHRESLQRNSGILAALPESNHRSVLYRKSSIPSSSKSIPFIPRNPQSQTERENSSQSLTVRKMNQSAPMNVPVLSIAMAKQRNSKFKDGDDEYDDRDDEEMLPPHEIVARGFRNSPKTTFSVLEGVGRTLKGRDLRQVRNAVWRQTGFHD